MFEWGGGGSLEWTFGNREDVDLVAPGFIEFGKDHEGGFGFIAVQGGID
jgi:hypothetical protein